MIRYAAPSAGGPIVAAQPAPPHAGAAFQTTLVGGRELGVVQPRRVDLNAFAPDLAHQISAVSTPIPVTPSNNFDSARRNSKNVSRM